MLYVSYQIVTTFIKSREHASFIILVLSMWRFHIKLDIFLDNFEFIRVEWSDKIKIYPTEFIQSYGRIYEYFGYPKWQWNWFIKNMDRTIIWVTKFMCQTFFVASGNCCCKRCTMLLKTFLYIHFHSCMFGCRPLKTKV